MKQGKAVMMVNDKNVIPLQFKLKKNQININRMVLIQSSMELFGFDFGLKTKQVFIYKHPSVILVA